MGSGGTGGRNISGAHIAIEFSRLPDVEEITSLQQVSTNTFLISPCSILRSVRQTHESWWKGNWRQLYTWRVQHTRSQSLAGRLGELTTAKRHTGKYRPGQFESNFPLKSLLVMSHPSF